MTRMQRAESIFGIFSAIAGAVGFALYMLLPRFQRTYVRSGEPALVSLFHTGFGSRLIHHFVWYLPFLLVVLLIAIGALLHAMRRSRQMALLLWVATGLLWVGTYPSFVYDIFIEHVYDLNSFLIVSVAMSFLASALAVGVEIQHRNRLRLG